MLVDEVDGLEAGREGCIMGVRDDMLTVGCQTPGRLHLVLAHTWQVLPRELFRRLSKREGGSKSVMVTLKKAESNATLQTFKHRKQETRQRDAKRDTSTRASLSSSSERTISIFR